MNCHSIVGYYLHSPIGIQLLQWSTYALLHPRHTSTLRAPLAKHDDLLEQGGTSKFLADIQAGATNI
jgi:hypothetical protein